MNLEDHLIDKYRQIIADRYDYSKLTEFKPLPEGITRETVEEIRDYFLNSIYPEPAKRHELDEAFAQLQSYVHQPAKVWGILGNLTGAIFRFGSMLPAALKTGIISMEAFSAAKNFEQTMKKAALASEYTLPLTDEQFIHCLSTLPRAKLDSFALDVGRLFRSMANTKLLSKTIEIMKDVVKKMESKPQVYTKDEIAGINMGLDIMQKGLELFSKYPEKTKDKMVEYIVERERLFIDEVYFKTREG
ncbi:hypothetical protein BH09BAC1_BH09BAC1_05790 [soil metagenome]